MKPLRSTFGFSLKRLEHLDRRGSGGEGVLWRGVRRETGRRTVKREIARDNQGGVGRRIGRVRKGEGGNREEGNCKGGGLSKG